jgi:hypothetical protein
MASDSDEDSGCYSADDCSENETEYKAVRSKSDKKSACERNSKNIAFNFARDAKPIGEPHESECSHN